MRTSGENIPFRERLGCTIKEACAASGLGPTMIYELIADGTLKSTKVKKRRVVSVPSLLVLIEGDLSERPANGPRVA